MMDIHSEDKLKDVHPELAARVRKMAEQLAVENIEIRVVQGLRSWSQQEYLYSQGRDDDGNVVDKAKVVTNARPGHSYHNFGLAVDVAPFNAGVPDWNANHPEWQRIVAAGESCGLVSGAKWRSFPDYPHFQLTGVLPVSPNDEVRQTFLEAGMESVWKETGLNA